MKNTKTKLAIIAIILLIALVTYLIISGQGEALTAISLLLFVYAVIDIFRPAKEIRDR